ncbi:MAG: hypothetical protein RLY16_2769 [Bacteroidota bacterium]|jgi:hypothetical protein
MKPFLFASMCLFVVSAYAQNVGIGTSTPNEKLHVDSGAIRIGRSVWNAQSNNWLKYGDEDYVRIGEEGDDSLSIQARYIRITPPPAYGVFGKVLLNGTLQIKDAFGSQGVGKVLTSDADGNASWMKPANANTGFRAQVGSGTTIPLPPCSGCIGLATINWPLSVYDDGGALFGSTYTAPSNGVYHFDANLTFSISGIANTSGNALGIRLLTSSGIDQRVYNNLHANDNGGIVTAQISTDVKLLAGQTVTIEGINFSGTILTVANGFFSGHKIY